MAARRVSLVTGLVCLVGCNGLGGSALETHLGGGGGVSTSLGGLVMSAPQRCLAGPSEVAGDEGMAVAQGLSELEVSEAMSGFVPKTLRCVPAGWHTSGVIDTEITVGCDGRVSEVEVLDAGGFPAEMVECVRDTLRYAPFPAHDRADGFLFGYPLRFKF